MDQQHHPISNWEEKKQQLRKEYPHLTADDLLYEIGKEKELLQRLQQKLDKNEEEMRKWLSLMGG